MVAFVFKKFRSLTVCFGCHQLQTEQVAVGTLAEFAGFDADFVFGKRSIQRFA